MEYFILLVLHVGVILTCEEPVGNIAQFEKYDAAVPASHLPLKYDSKGLQPFFDLANSFMNTVQPKSFGKEFHGIDYTNVTDHGDKIKKYETPIAVAVAFGVLFVLLMPCIGCFFCCCRCAGNCGGKMFQDPKSSTQHTKCSIIAFALLVVAIFMLCGVLFMFVTNDRIHSTANNIGDTYEQVVDDVMNIANSTIRAASHIGTVLVPCIIKLAKDDISTPGIQLQVGIPLRTLISQNVSAVLDRAQSASNNLDSMYTQFNDVKTLKGELQNLSNILTTELDNTKTELDAIVNDCRAAPGVPSEKCDALQSIADQLNVKINFADLPDTNNETKKLKAAKDLNLYDNIEKGKQTINDIPSTTSTKSNTTRNDVKNEIEKAEIDVKKQVDDVINNIMKNIIDKRQSYLKTRDDYFTKDSDYFKYEDYRWRGYIGLCCVMTLIVLLIGFGLTLGTCGYKKDLQPSKRTSLANCGGNCLMSAVGIMFIFSAIMMIFCILWYVVGIHLYIVCRDLEDGALIDDLHTLKPLNNEILSVEKTLKNCRNNMPLFAALEGDRFFNITEKLDINQYIPNIGDEISKVKVDLSDKEILNADAESSLNDLINSGVDSVNFQKFFDTLNQDITVNLNDTSQNLSNIANDVPSLATRINTVISNLTTIEAGSLPSIKQNMKLLEGNISGLQEKSKNLKNNTIQLLSELKGAEAYIKSPELQGEISKLVQKLADRMIGWFEQGTTHLINGLQTEWLKCKPVSNLYDGAHTFMCDNVVQNTNGFWLALGWCLLFFVPAIILSVKLAKYFRKMDYDSGYDDQVHHPPYNDKIPLQSIQPSDFIPRPTYAAHNPHHNAPGRVSSVNRQLDVQRLLIGELENRPTLGYNSISEDTTSDHGTNHATPFTTTAATTNNSPPDLTYDNNPPPPYNHENTGYAHY